MVVDTTYSNNSHCGGYGSGSNKKDNEIKGAISTHHLSARSFISAPL